VEGRDVCNMGGTLLLHCTPRPNAPATQSSSIRIVPEKMMGYWLREFQKSYDKDDWVEAGRYSVYIESSQPILEKSPTVLITE